MLKLILKEGKEKPVIHRHPWIFSGAIENIDDLQAGEIVSVYSHQKDLLGKALVSTSSIFAHMLSFYDDSIEKTFEKRIISAIALRKNLIKMTNAYRLIHAEADGIPGVMVDVYNDVLVIQFSLSYPQGLKEYLLSLLVKYLSPKAIYEKSTTNLSKQTGQEEKVGFLYGNSVTQIEIVENGIHFMIDFENGQKTGFFLDQRENRQLISEHSQNRAVLNCFAYTGAFSLAAFKGGSNRVDSVEISKKSLDVLEKNLSLNGFEKKLHKSVCEDVFSYLENNDLSYDLIILDPPSFAKKKADIPAACKGYKQINRLVFEKAPENTLLLTCSCSSQIDEKLFQSLLFQAAFEAKRDVKIVHKHRQAFDHPISIYHPELCYLKSFFLFIK